MKDLVYIFTDGASRGNPGPGGFGSIIVSGNRVTELGGHEEKTTNNRMELTAAIKALEFVSSYKLKAKSFKLFSDSSYLINGATKWLHVWKQNGWISKTTKQLVLNRDLWEGLDELIEKIEVNWIYIGGHVGISGNERADTIATAHADQKKITLYSGVLSDYPVKNILNISLNESMSAKKNADRERQKARAYSYVSMVNGKIETHATWAECESRIKGKSGARYRKTLSKEDENALVKQWSNA